MFSECLKYLQPSSQVFHLLIAMTDDRNPLKILQVPNIILNIYTCNRKERKKERKSWYNLWFLPAEKITERFLCWFACNPPEPPEARHLFYDERAKICGRRTGRQGWRSYVAIQPLPWASPSSGGAGRTPPGCISWAAGASSPPSGPRSPSPREGTAAPGWPGRCGGRMTGSWRPRLQCSPQPSRPPPLGCVETLSASSYSPPPVSLTLLGGWALYLPGSASALLFPPPTRSPEYSP